MANEDRTASHAVDLHRALEKAPFSFDFYQALRRLECAHRDKPRLGDSPRSVDDPVRLSQEPSLVFAPATVKSFGGGHRGKPPRLAVWFFGLLGPNGPLPLHVTEYARDRIKNSKDPTLMRFLDIFHHRLLALFYRSWANAQPTVNFDRPESDRFATYVGSLFGVGMASLRKRDAMPDLAKLYFAGHLACQTRHADGLRGLLVGFFRLPVDIEQFVGHSMELPESSRCRLGASHDTGVLGQSVIVGERIWECQQSFRITFGPMGLEDYLRFLPGGATLERLVAVVRNYVGDELIWKLQLILKKEEVPELRLGQTGQLGWTTWLAGRPQEKDADDLLLAPLAHVA